MIAAGAYLRLSTEDQSDNYSLGNQREALTLLAARSGAVISGWYEDAKSYRGDDGKLVEPSARRSDRPAWRQLLADADAGRINAILALDHTRLAGDFGPMTQLIECVERNRLQVLLVSETFDTEISIFHSWARRQWYRQHTARSHAGRRSRAAAGLHPGRAPLFYRTIRNDQGKSTGYELREEFRPWLDELARMFLAGASYLRIAQTLDRNPTTGRKIDSHGVKLLISNPWFRGLVEFGRRADAPRVIAAGRHLAVWDAATGAAIEAELDRRRVVGRSTERGGRFLFSGILRCGVCGHLMVGHSGVSRGHRYTSYSCSMGLRASRGRTDSVAPHTNNLNEIKLLGILRQALAEITPADVDALLPLIALPRSGGGAAPASDQELADLDRQAADLRADLDVVSSPAARRAIAADLERVTRRTQALRAAAESRAAPPDLAHMRGPIMEFVSDPGWLDWPAERLRPALKAAFPALYVAGGGLCSPPENSLRL